MQGNMQFQKTVKTKSFKAEKDATMNKQSTTNKGKSNKHTWQRVDKRNFEVI
jgi:hypothetical protein